MSQNTVSLSQEIKKELRFLNLKRVSIVFGAIGVVFATALMISLSVVGLSPQGLLIMMFPTYGMALFVSGIAIGALISGAVAIGCVRFSKQKVRPYVNIPNEVESLKDGLIALGAFVTTIENTVNAKQIANIFYNISKRFKKVESRITRLEENELDYNRIILDQRKLIFKLEMRLKEKDLDKEETKKLQVELQGALETIAKSNERIIQLENKIKELGDK